jgi:hypothetical protein
MEREFFRFGGATNLDVVRILPRSLYDPVSLLNLGSGLSEGEVFYIDEGHKVYGIIEFNDPSNFAISFKVKKILEDNRVTGWGCFPIRIEGIASPYFAFLNLAKAGPILNLEDVNNYRTKNRHFDVATWDGSDIFNLENTLLHVCVPRVKKLLIEAKVTNLEILPL